MKVKTELPESTKPERAWMDKDILMVEYHKFQETGFVYVDARAMISLAHLVSYTMYFGKRKGFKRLEIFYRALSNRAVTKLSLSANHKELVISIYKLLKEMNIKPRREVI